MSRASRAPADPKSGAAATRASAKSPSRKEQVQHNLTEEELDDIKQAFDLFDTDASGTINPREVAAAVNSLGSDRSASIFRLLNGLEDVADEIDYEAFLGHIVERLGNRSFTAGIQRIFELFDADNSGTIDLTKLKRVARELGESLTDEDLEEALKRNSSGGNALLTPDDFYVVMTKKFYQ
jgi:Ca2+-binding EF-hand superfamily protein